MEVTSVESRHMPYKIAVGRTIIECERPEEVLAIAELLANSQQSKCLKEVQQHSV